MGAALGHVRRCTAAQACVEDVMRVDDELLGDAGIELGVRRVRRVSRNRFVRDWSYSAGNPRRVLDGLSDALIRPAPADVALHCRVDVRV